jgi:hypothetical protein
LASLLVKKYLYQENECAIVLILTLGLGCSAHDGSSPMCFTSASLNTNGLISFETVVGLLVRVCFLVFLVFVAVLVDLVATLAIGFSSGVER